MKTNLGIENHRRIDATTRFPDKFANARCFTRVIKCLDEWTYELDGNDGASNFDFRMGEINSLYFPALAFTDMDSSERRLLLGIRNFFCHGSNLGVYCAWVSKTKGKMESPFTDWRVLHSDGC
jgi:hypothetical protein